MARFTRVQVLNTMYDLSVVPVFYHADIEVAKNVVAAISRGGCKLVEFVNRGDHAFEVFSDLERHFAKADPTLIVGIDYLFWFCYGAGYTDAQRLDVIR